MSSALAQAEDPVAESLLRRMAEAYASAKSYSDTGVVFHYHKERRDPSSTAFRIVFVRPDHLRFEMTNNVGSHHLPEEYSVLWSDGRSTCSWSQSDHQIKTNGDVLAGISGFTGISGRSVHNIPSLLQKDFGWQEYLYEISSPRALGDEVFEKTNCYRIQGRGTGNRQFEIWLGKSDYLIRKIRTTYPDWQAEEIHRNIAIDQQISPDMLTFTPPKLSESPAKN
jgi:outer membrane lipoprotein-sorting protein